MPSKVWDKITYPFPNFNSCTVDVLGMDKLFHPTLYNGCNYLSMLGFKLIHVSKRTPGDIYLHQWDGPSFIQVMMSGTYSVPSHYLNQWWLIFHWDFKNKLQWNKKKTFQKMYLNASHFVQASICYSRNDLSENSTDRNEKQSLR